MTTIRLFTVRSQWTVLSTAKRIVHAEGCRILRGKQVSPFRPASMAHRYARPCGICHPNIQLAAQKDT